MKTIYEYVDYREFVLDKMKDMPPCSNRDRLRKIGIVGRPGYIASVFENRKEDLTVDTGKKFARYLCLTDDETTYFLTLIKYSRIIKKINKELNAQKNVLDFLEKERDSLLVELNGLRPLKPLENKFLSLEDKLRYYLTWETIAVREALLFNDKFGNRNETERMQLLHKFLPGLELTSEKINNAIKVLDELELIEKDDSGNYQGSDTSIRPRNKSSISNPILTQFLNLAVKVINSLPDATLRVCRNVVVNISEETYNAIEAKANALCQEILEIAKKNASPPDRVYSFGVQFYPLTLPLELIREIGKK